MARKKVFGLLIGLLTLIACQPQLILVEVTRIVEVAPTVDTLLPGESAAGADEMQSVEVTRLVSQEVTRVVTQTVVEEVVLEQQRPALGSGERPVQLLFPAVAGAEVIARRGQALSQRLAADTGLQYAVGILDDEAHLIQLMCSAPDETVGFLSSYGYAMAHKQCDVQVGSVALREDELSWQAGMIVARRDSGISSLQDLAGRTWAVPDVESLSRSLYFQALLADAGVSVADAVEVPGDSSAMLAVYNRDVDFATAAYVPPILPYEDRRWVFGEDSPEIWRRVGISPQRSPIGYVLVNGEPDFGGYRLRDARSRIFDTAPGIYDETFILVLSAPIPNDTVVFGANFPLAMARDVSAALTDLVNSEACVESVCSTDFLGWTGLESAVDESYEPLRFIIGTLDVTDLENIKP